MFSLSDSKASNRSGSKPYCQPNATRWPAAAISADDQRREQETRAGAGERNQDLRSRAVVRRMIRRQPAEAVQRDPRLPAVGPRRQGVAHLVNQDRHENRAHPKQHVERLLVSAQAEQQGHEPRTTDARAPECPAR